MEGSCPASESGKGLSTGGKARGSQEHDDAYSHLGTVARRALFLSKQRRRRAQCHAGETKALPSRLSRVFTAGSLANSDWNTGSEDN